MNILPTCLTWRLLGRRGRSWGGGEQGERAEEGEEWGLFPKQPDARTLWNHPSCAPQTPTRRKATWEASGLDSYLFRHLEGLQCGHIFFFLPFLSLSFFSCEMGMNYPVDVPRPSRGNWLWPPPPSRPGLPRGKRLRSSGSLVRAGHAEHGAVTADQAGGRCSDFSMCRLTARLADCVHRQCRRGPRERERLRPGLETRVQPSSKRMMLACFL